MLDYLNYVKAQLKDGKKLGYAVLKASNDVEIREKILRSVAFHMHADTTTIQAINLAIKSLEIDVRDYSPYNLMPFNK